MKSITKQSFSITHIGSRYTKSWFKNSDKDTIIVTAWIDSFVHGHNSICVFKHSIEVKGYKKRNIDFKYYSNSYNDDRYKKYITEQQLYESYHNHWDKINPIRMFSKGQFNSDVLIKDDIEHIEISKTHKAY